MMSRLIAAGAVLLLACDSSTSAPTRSAAFDGLATSGFPAATPLVDAGRVDENFECDGRYTGSFDNVFVPEGATCAIEQSRVSGSILARDGSRLFVVGTTVDGNIDGNEAAVVQVSGGRLGGNIQVQDGSSPGELGVSVSGGTVLTQGNIQVQKMRTAGIRIDGAVLEKGNIQVQENVVDRALEVTGNRVAQNVQVFVNSGAGSKSITGNTVGQTLECKENREPFTGGPNRAGEAKEQCF